MATKGTKKDSFSSLLPENVRGQLTPNIAKATQDDLASLALGRPTDLAAKLTFRDIQSLNDAIAGSQFVTFGNDAGGCCCCCCSQR